MAAMQQPFSDDEVRYFLAEILKKSSIAPEDLMNLIQERGVQPSWYEIALPNGRSVSSCIVVWQHLQANAHARLTNRVQPMVAFEQPSPQNVSKSKKKRPASAENVPSAVDRMIQPQQPFNFATVNAPSNSATDQASTVPISWGPPKKKRGRPSKAEHEAKVAEAAARGEEYQPSLKRKKTPRQSLQGAPNAGMATPSMAEAGAAGEGSIGKKNARKSKTAPREANSPALEPTPRSLALKATAHAANQMQNQEETHVRSTIPETQASDVEARESFLAEMREHAEHIVPDTVQSTMTLPHDSAPQTDFTSYQGPTRDPETTGRQRFL